MLEAEKHTLDVDLKSLKESANRETHELKLCITELKSQHENERHYLNDNLAQVRSDSFQMFIWTHLGLYLNH